MTHSLASPRAQNGLPDVPTGWLTFCKSQEIDRTPQTRTLLGKQLVAFRTESGRVAVMHARCAHMGADLSQGRIVGESIRCPFHHWQFGVDGACTHIPAEPQRTSMACQQAYVACEKHGLVFLFHGGDPTYELPSFHGVESHHLRRARPFTMTVDCPWYMVGANGVDLQHFQTTHDRELLEAPHVNHPQPHVHRTKTHFAVVGRGPADFLTRFAGSKVTMDVTDYAGSLFFVRAMFRRTQTFGLVGLLPLESAKTMVFVSVSVRRSAGRVGRRIFDPANAAIRRWFVYNFLRPDIARSAGTDYHPDRLIEADQLMFDYFQWLREVHN